MERGMAKTFEAFQRHISSKKSTAGISFSAEQFPDLFSRKQLAELKKKMDLFFKKQAAKVFCISGCRGGEGVSTIIANLVQYLTTESDQSKTLIIDAQRQHPVLHNIWNVDNSPGIFDNLGAPDNLWEQIMEIDNKIAFIPCGNPDVLSGGRALYETISILLDKKTNCFDRIIIDAPPVLQSADSLYLSMASDITLLTIAAGVTTKEVAERAKTILDDNECIIGGILLNRARQVIPKYLYNLF